MQIYFSEEVEKLNPVLHVKAADDEFYVRCSAWLGLVRSDSARSKSIFYIVEQIHTQSNASHTDTTTATSA